MKKGFYLFAAVVFATGFVSCSNDDDHDSGRAEQNLGFRAATLGYSDVASYQASVAEQCAAGNHENCDILTNGTHQACGYPEHGGISHDGSHHNGTGHGMHNANGHSHGSHGNHHNSGGHHQ